MSKNITTVASSQWASRPSDERFTSLTEMSQHFHSIRNNSRAVVTSTAKLHVRPTGEKGLELVGSAEVGYEPTNYSFGQLSTLAEAPASYLRTLPPAMAADCLNYGLKYKRDIEDVGLLLTKNDRNELRAATGPRYGRIWNSDVVDAMISRFGDGVTGQWKVPGEFGKPLAQVTKKNTTLYGSDRDMFTFLADEANRIEVGGRTLARGFFVWNSEVGAATFGLGTFLYDYVCCNRMIWGSRDYTEIKYRHTASAPDRFLMEVTPAIKRYSEGSTSNIVLAIESARADRLNDVDEWLAKRYGPKQVASIKAIHELEENRPIETRWDVIVATTARARGIEHQNERVIAEREAGALLGNN